MDTRSDFPFVVPLEGGSNFRDLGGHRTADGATVRRGAVFRSAHLGGLTDTDRAALGKLGVRTIVDLRGVSEAAETPHLIEGLACNVVGAHIEPRRRREDPRRGRPTAAPTPFLMMQFLTDHYRDYPRRCAPGFRTLFATLSDGTHRPLVFHCTAGKDRTGFASALLLTLLGVPWDDVMEDYLRTNELWTGHIGRYPELDIDTRAAIVEARTALSRGRLRRRARRLRLPRSLRREGARPRRRGPRAAEGGFAGRLGLLPRTSGSSPRPGSTLAMAVLTRLSQSLDHLPRDLERRIGVRVEHPEVDLSLHFGQHETGRRVVGERAAKVQQRNKRRRRPISAAVPRC